MASIFGDTIKNPLSETFKESYGDLTNTGGGLIGFLSNVLKTITIAGGIFFLINIIIAGFTYISAGYDPKQTVVAWQRIYMSLLGLVVMVAAYALAGIVGYLLFGDASIILNPKIYGPGTPQP